MADFAEGKHRPAGGHHRGRGGRQCPQRLPSWSSNRPSASAWPSSTSCAAGSGAARGESACVLLYDPPLSDTSRSGWTSCGAPTTASRSPRRTRSCAAAATPWALRQSGFPAYVFADPAAHRDLIAAAGDDARMIVGRDPELDLRARQGAAGAPGTVRLGTKLPDEGCGLNLRKRCQLTLTIRLPRFSPASRPTRRRRACSPAPRSRPPAPSAGPLSTQLLQVGEAPARPCRRSPRR